MEITNEQGAAKLLEVALTQAGKRKICMLKILVGDLLVLFPDEPALCFQKLAVVFDWEDFN